MKTNPGQIGLAQIQEFQKDFESRPACRVAMNAVTRGNLNEIAINRDVLNDSDMVFSEEIESGGPITDQKAAGTCWLFAELNWLRIYMAKKKKMKGIEFSENFVMFWDKFEKSNYFLENIIALRDRDMDDRHVHYLLTSPAGDGGEWNMLVNIINKYGLVPKSAMVDTFNREASRFLNERLHYRLRIGAKQIHDAHRARKNLAALRALKNDILNDCYRILVIFLGEPPQRFDWGWRDKDKKFHRERNMTPQQFYKKYVGIDPNETYALLHCPMNGLSYDRTYQVQYFQNVWGGTELTFLHIKLQEIKDMALRILKKKEPVLFGCEVRQFSHSKEGILDTNLYDFDLMFDMRFDLDKGERFQYQQGCMTHAMVLTGVDIVRGKPRKWKVENSWGEQFGKKGYFIMSDEWFDENVYELVILKKFMTPRLRKLAKKKPIVLSPWHPLS
jgi:bleomycin hydrolase